MWTSEDESIHFCWFPEVSPGDSESFHRTDHFGPSPLKPSKLAQGLATATSEVSVRIVGGEVCSVPFCVLEKQWQVVVGKKGHRFLF